MDSEILNCDLLKENTCFGCGHENPQGLKIEIRRDPENSDGLKGVFHSEPHMIGFPGTIHGGAIYTALDCMACWTPMVFRREREAVWVLRSAQVQYLRPAHAGEALYLRSFIQCEKETPDSIEVHVEARNGKGKRLVEGAFIVVPLSLEKFQKTANLQEVPGNWRAFLRR